MSFLTRRVVGAALTVNALRPLPGFRAGIPAFAFGWLTDELAPHLLGLTALDTAIAVRRHRASAPGLAAAAVTGAGLLWLIRQSQRVKDVVSEALERDLGVDYVEQLDEAPSPAEFATPWRQIARPFRFDEAGVRVVRDVAYSEFGKRGHLDLVLPDAEGLSGAPVLLQVHGGGWTIGEKEQQGQPLMHRMAAKGWVCVAINYRLAPRDPFPAHIQDVKRAIAWIREHIGEYGGDADYLAITGGSAGGHLAALAAVTQNDPAYQPGFEDADTSIQAAVPFYGVYDFAGASGLTSAELMRDHFLAKRIVQRRFHDDPTVFEQGSPLLRVSEDVPDFFVLHGTHDTLVDVGQARAFVEKLREVSPNKVVYAELPGAQHAFDIFHSIRGAHVVRAVDRFLTWSWNRHRAAGVSARRRSRRRPDRRGQRGRPRIRSPTTLSRICVVAARDRQAPRQQHLVDRAVDLVATEQDTWTEQVDDELGGLLAGADAEQLRHRRLGSRLRPGERAQRRAQPEQRADGGQRDLLPHLDLRDRVVTEQLDRPLGGGTEPERPHRHALAGQRRTRQLPAVPRLADDVAVGDEHVVEEDLVEDRVAGRLAQRPDVDAVAGHVDEEVGDAPVRGHVRIGAGQADAPVGLVGAGGPDLLAGQLPAAIGAYRLRPQRGEVGAGAGLGEQLAPGELAELGRAHEPLALLLGAVGEDRRHGPAADHQVRPGPRRPRRAPGR